MRCCVPTIFSVLIFQSLCFAQDKEVEAPFLRRSASTKVMGTSLEIAVLGRDESVLDRAIRAAIKEMRRVEAVFTTWKPHSIISKINREAGQGPVAVPREVILLTKQARWVSRKTEGAFDLTWGSVGKLWDFKDKASPLPSEKAIRLASRGVGYDKVVLDESAGTLELPRKTTIGFGGIAKGYGVDRAIEVLKSHGIKNAIVNAGGDARVMGRDFGKPFNVTIKHPRHKSRYLAILPVSNVAVVTSGDYERFIEVDGKRHSHILDPRTGWPVAHTQSVTVIAPTASLADALSTGVFVLGVKKGLELVDSLPGVEALIVDSEAKLHLSAALRGGPKKTLHLPKKD